jgi:hypothetical protein
MSFDESPAPGGARQGVHRIFVPSFSDIPSARPDGGFKIEGKLYGLPSWSVLRMSCLAPENTAIIGDWCYSHVAQASHFFRPGAGLMGDSARKSIGPIALVTSNEEMAIHQR